MFENDFLLYVFAFLAGLSKAMRDTIDFHFNRSIFICWSPNCKCGYAVTFKRYLEKLNYEKNKSICYDFSLILDFKHKLFYWLESSWEYQKEYRKKYPVLSRIFWFIFDGWHFFEISHTVFIFVAALFVQSFIDAIYLFVMSALVFNIFFHYVFLSKTYEQV